MRPCVLALGLTLALTACGGTGVHRFSQGDPNTLEVTRKDGSRVLFSDQVFASCDLDHGKRVLTVQAAQVPSAKPRLGFWTFSRETETIESSPKLDFPDREDGALFVLDPRTGYELSSDNYGASGGLVVEEWGCDRGDDVRIRVDGKLQSDVHGLESVTSVTGELVATIND